MQEYSRKAATAESRLEELHKRSVHHDDHLRLIDAWWLQVSIRAMTSDKARLTLASSWRKSSIWPSPQCPEQLNPQVCLIGFLPRVLKLTRSR